MSRTHRRPVEAFEAIFRAINRQQEPVLLVGGHAVNAWALTYQDRIGEQLAALMPFTSGDIDVYATRNALMALHRELGGKLLLSGPRELTDGTIVVGEEPDTRELDVLRSVNGLSGSEVRSTVDLEVCGWTVPVLFPHLLLKAKLMNALKLDQDGRQDVKHVKIMALVLREFLKDLVFTASAGSEKPALQLLREAVAVLTSEDACEVGRRHEIPFVDVVPVDELLKSPLTKISNFARKELPRRLAVKSGAKGGKRSVREDRSPN